MSVDRAGYIAGLRALADALEADESLELPYSGGSSPLTVFSYDLDSFLAYRALLQDARQVVSTRASTFRVELHGSLEGLNVRVHLDDKVAFAEPAPEPVLPALRPELLNAPAVTS